MEGGRVFSMLLLFIIFGSLGLTNFSAGSFAPGMLFVSVLILLYQFVFPRRLFVKKSLLVSWLLGFIFICFFSIVSFCVNYYFDFPRFLYSLLSLFWIVISLYIFLRGEAFFASDKYIVVMFVLFVFFGVLGVLGVSFVVGEQSKPVFIFSEPSHYAAAASIFFISAAYRFRRSLGFIMVIPVVILAVKLQSLMLIFVAVSMILASFPLLGSFLGCCGVFFLMALGVGDGSNYFLERLSLDSNNLSVLTLMHGWENAFIALKNTGGLGVGFQQLGVYPYTGAMSAKIVEMTGFSMSLFDGGSLAPKIIAEFGLVGVGFVLYILYLNFNIIMCLLRNVPLNPLFVGVFFSLILELFFRGFGYFSVTFVSALYFLVCGGFKYPKVVGGHD